MRSTSDKEGPSKLQEALIIAEALKPDELVELAEKVRSLQKTLPMALSQIPANVALVTRTSLCGAMVK